MVESDSSGDEQPAGLASRFHAIRKLKGSTQEEFSTSIGISRAFYGTVERGGSNPNVTMVSGIARAYPEISLLWLLTGQGQMIRGKGVKLNPVLINNIAVIFETQLIVAEGERGVIAPIDEIQQADKDSLHRLMVKFRLRHAHRTASIISALYESVANMDDESNQAEEIKRLAQGYASVFAANPIP